MSRSLKRITSVAIFITIMLISWFDSLFIPNTIFRLSFSLVIGYIGGSVIAKILLGATWKEIFKIHTFFLVKRWKKMSKCDECWVSKKKFRNAGTCGTCMEDPEFWYILNGKEIMDAKESSNG